MVISHNCIDTIYNEDCLVGMSRIPDHSVDLVVCDLPYGTTRNKWDVIIPLDKLWGEYKRVLKPNGAVLLFAQPPFSAILGASNIEWFKYEWIWKKTNSTGFLNANRCPLKIHENILVFYEHLPVYNPQKFKGMPYFRRKNNERERGSYNFYKEKDTVNKDGMRYPVDILEFKCERGLHPTQKPVGLIRYIIRTYSNEGDLVLDNCMGSGTTAAACIQEKRHFIGFEVNEEYYQKSLERINRAIEDEGKSNESNRVGQSI